MLFVVFVCSPYQRHGKKNSTRQGEGRHLECFIFSENRPGGGGTRAKIKILCLPFRSLATVWRVHDKRTVCVLSKTNRSTTRTAGRPEQIKKALWNTSQTFYYFYRGDTFVPVLPDQRNATVSILVRETTEP